MSSRMGGKACRAGCAFAFLLPLCASPLLPLCACFPTSTPRTVTRETPLSNRHLMQLEFPVSHAVSTTSLFLIDPNSPYFPRPFTSRNFPARPCVLQPEPALSSGGFS